MTYTTEQLRLIAHGIGHYNDTHGNLSILSFPRYTCDDPATWIRHVGYRDLWAVFEELAQCRESYHQSERLLLEEHAEVLRLRHICEIWEVNRPAAQEMWDKERKP